MEIPKEAAPKTMMKFCQSLHDIISQELAMGSTQQHFNHQESSSNGGLKAGTCLQQLLQDPLPFLAVNGDAHGLGHNKQQGSCIREQTCWSLHVASHQAPQNKADKH